jgi:Fic family protein
MMTFRQLLAGNPVPMATAWLVGDLGVALGRQELFTRQSPQRLRVLREHALIESAVSSNRIEGVEVEQSRVTTLMFGKPSLRDRNEEEVRGYRSALDLVHGQAANLPATVDTIRELHRLTRGNSWDGGQFKERAEPIIERYPDGRTRVRFQLVAAGEPTEAAMAELVGHWAATQKDRSVAGLVAMAAFSLDFLCIHPFRDGNGRVSRLLMVLLSYHAGAQVGRYVSLERLIEQNKDRYYETLEQSSHGWHEGGHDPWPFVNYVLWLMKQAYAEFESRVGETVDERGAKEDLVRQTIARQVGPFRLADLERACPGVGRDWIRAILRDMKRANELRSFGHGAGARWQRT